MSVDNIQTNLIGLGIDISHSNSRTVQQKLNQTIAFKKEYITSKSVLSLPKQTQLQEKKDAAIFGGSALSNKNKEKLNAPNEKNIAKSLDTINKLLSLQNTNLIFRYDKKAKIPIIMVVDKQTKKVISEIPSKNLQKIAQALNDVVESMNKSGILFNSKV